MHRSLNIRIAIFTSVFLLLTAEPSLAGLSATSVTSATTWEEEDGTDNNAASQYLNLWTDATLLGFRLDFEGYGRITTLEEEVQPGDNNPNRLYHLTLTVSDAEDRGELTVGRQFIPSLTGPVMLDGVRLSTGNSVLTFNARWGQASDVDGEGEEEQKVAGAGLDYVIRKGMHFTLDYGRTYNEGLLTELVAAEWIYSWHRHTKAYVLFNWDLMSHTLHESLLGTRLFFSDKFSMILELSQNVQTFDSDSIYSVFAVDSAHTQSFSLLFTPSPTTRYVWDFAAESYQGSGTGRQYGVSGHWSPGMWKISTGLLQHKGYGGELTEITADFSTRLIGRFRLGMGGDFSRTKNSGEETVTSSLVHAGARWDLSSKTALDLRLEQVNDELTESSRSARISWEVKF